MPGSTLASSSSLQLSLNLLQSWKSWILLPLLTYQQTLRLSRLMILQSYTNGGFDPARWMLMHSSVSTSCLPCSALFMELFARLWEGKYSSYALKFSVIIMILDYCIYLSSKPTWYMYPFILSSSILSLMLTKPPMSRNSLVSNRVTTGERSTTVSHLVYQLRPYWSQLRLFMEIQRSSSAQSLALTI